MAENLLFRSVNFFQVFQIERIQFPEMEKKSESSRKGTYTFRDEEDIALFAQFIANLDPFQFYYFGRGSSGNVLKIFASIAWL